MANAREVDLLLSLDRSTTAAEGLTRQIYGQLRAAILSGRLRAGDRLPATRDLAHRVGAARLTVATAYDWLRAEGYVYGRVGAGTFVAPALGEARVSAGVGGAGHDEDIATPPLFMSTTASAPKSPAPHDDDAERPPLTAWARRIATIPLIGAGSSDAAPFDFRPGIGDAEAFPWARWRRIVGWQDPIDRFAARRDSARESALRAGRWDALLGPLETREAIAAWLRRSRAVRCEPEQVLIAGSVQQMLALLARLLVEPGQSLIVEDPSYVGFHAAFLAEGAILRGVPVDTSGLRIDALPDPAGRPASTAAHLAVVTPSHQYPTGVTLALERRLGLLDWARRARVVVVEDDYDGDLRLEGQPLEALRGLDDGDEVIYLGTFAKALYPALRLGYAVLPRWLVEPVARARAASDRHPTWRDALAVARFIEAGELERHLARVRRLYRARRDALVEVLRAELGDLVSIGPAEAGIHLLAGLPDGTDDTAITTRAQADGLAITPLSPHYGAAPRPGLLLGFGALDEERLAQGIRRLAPLVRAAVVS
ncbi:MAG TPA: PLP-dependent aminotransferase family protein [Ktedonobacterales bacterium]|nr:PLP-dependent aminotransferase family protein [Ktedonobacterales bacterium]